MTYNNGTRTATLDPNANLDYDTTYTAKLTGGTGGIADPAGNKLATDTTWSFTTASPPPPPPDEGPGGPILVIGTAANPFSRYYAEILRTEGLNAFTVTDITNVDATLLNNYDVVILGEMSLSGAQVTLLTDWVNAGGNLIAMRPDSQLASLLGLTSAGTTLSEGYLLVNTASAPGAGIVDQTIQFHGTADRYSLNGATSVATLYSNAGTSTTNPAVTVRSVGTNGGQAAAFTYDLAKSIVLTRQGNPAWAGINGDDSSGPVRSDDMFHNGTDTDWVNLDKVAIPQADEQQRLLANLIGFMNLDREPLPRFWYFPRGDKAEVILTADEHGATGVPGRLDHQKSFSPPGCSVADWECVLSTVYLYTNTSNLTDAQAAAYAADGFEIALHVSTECGNWTDPANLESIYATQLGEFSAKYTSIPAPTTNRTHCIAWSDWDTQAQVELAHNIRLDTNYYFWPDAWVQDRPGMFTGSGMPMRFADTDGTMVDVYQATTQMTDELGQTYPYTIDTLLDHALGPEGYYGAFTANLHVDSNGDAHADPVITSAQARGVSVITAQQMLTWLDGRNASSFANIAWAGNSLSFDVNADSGANGLQAMAPAQNGNLSLQSLTRNGSPVTFTVETIKGVSYARFAAPSGAYVAQYAADTTAPTVTAVTPLADSTGIAVNTTTIAEFSEPIDLLTLNGGGFELRDTVADTVVPATINYNASTQVATLTSNAALAPSTQYTAKLKGGTGGVSDVAGNPLASDYQLVVYYQRVHLYLPMLDLG